MRGKINGGGHCPAAHGDLVADSSLAGPTNHVSILLDLRFPQRDYRTRYVHFSFKFAHRKSA